MTSQVCAKPSVELLQAADWFHDQLDKGDRINLILQHLCIYSSGAERDVYFSQQQHIINWRGLCSSGLHISLEHGTSMDLGPPWALRCRDPQNLLCTKSPDRFKAGRIFTIF